MITPILNQALQKAVNKCTSCKETGCPLQSRKISFGKILSSFSHHVQLDFFYRAEFDDAPIFHMVEVHTGYSAASLMQTREMYEAARQLEVAWINVHDAPSIISGDIEFFNSHFADALRYFSIQFEPRPARRHNKLGVVERKNEVVRVVLQRLLKDASKSLVCVVASVERK